jgi:hypothetical protein
MSWQEEFPIIIRYMINDISAPQTYTDDGLRELALISALRTNAEISFPNMYTVDIVGSGLSPDPTAAPRDDNFISLVSLKAAYTLAFAEAKTSAGQGIAIKDGSSSIDLKGVAQYKFSLAQDLKSQYDDAKLAYQGGNHIIGSAILSPFRIYYPIQPYDPLRPLY